MAFSSPATCTSPRSGTDAVVDEPCLGQLWAPPGAPAHLAPSAGAVQHGGCGSQLARGLFLVESLDSGEKFAGLHPPSHSPQHRQICSGSAGKSRSQHPWDTARARAAFQAWELCTPVTEGLKQGGKERTNERTKEDFYRQRLLAQTQSHAQQKVWMKGSGQTYQNGRVRKAAPHVSVR